MELLMKQRMFKILDNFNILNTDGQIAYTVKGKFAVGHKLEFFDAQNNQIGTIHEEILHLFSHFAISVGDQKLGYIKRDMSFIHDKFEVDFKEWLVQGDFINWNYTVKDKQDNLIMTASKKFWNMTDTYAMDIINPEDAALCLMIVAAIDITKEEQLMMAASASSASYAASHKPKP